MENTNNGLVQILTSGYLHQIQIAKSILANNDIESYIVNENITSTIGTAIVENYRLQVSKLDFMKAKQILEEIDAEDK